MLEEMERRLAGKSLSLAAVVAYWPQYATTDVQVHPMSLSSVQPSIGAFALGMLLLLLCGLALSKAVNGPPWAGLAHAKCHSRRLACHTSRRMSGV